MCLLSLFNSRLLVWETSEPAWRRFWPSIPNEFYNEPVGALKSVAPSFET